MPLKFSDFSVPELMLELSSKCALACPRCDRTMFPEKFKAQELSLSLLQKRLTKPWLSKIKKFQLNGVYGDPIFHSQFHDVVEFLKSEGARIQIETSGYGRTPDWWSKLGPILGGNDTLTVSVDGLEDTNHLYRVGAKWNSLKESLLAIANLKCYRVWKFIVFKHNEHQIEAAKEFALELGFHDFRLVRSNRFGAWWTGGKEDILRPSSTFLGERLKRTEKQIPIEDVLQPRCMLSTRLPAISYQGVLFPCCWMVSHYADEPAFYSEGLNDVSLHEKSLEDCFRSKTMNKIAESFSDFNCAPSVCKLLCRKQDLDIQHSQTQNSDQIFNLQPMGN